MRAVIQRVKFASVTVNGQVTGSIGLGVAVFLGIHRNDGAAARDWMADKIVNLRLFSDQDEKMNLSLADIGAEMLIVSQFTLYGDCRKGRRPGYSEAAPPEIAEPLYNQFIELINKKGIRTATGTFQAKMEVSLINDGPVTLLVDSTKQF
ncbi:MAG: D-tyrosyl-tRNA(Tyr) deacylase [Desulfobacterales bacterium]|nr:D-tyrosyl-tRNA(Tyr) deacylase [Deltaproteobacteria bacterium]NNK95142.1 D-tyrosyl-tRNA(Tyr) deacylase [Desulfobacterales bacterium]